MKTKINAIKKVSILLIVVFACIALFSIAVSEAAEVKQSAKKVKIFDLKKGEVTTVDKIIKSDDEWRKLLTADEFKITRKKGTEPAFGGRYHDSKEAGTYKCVACGTDLFSSDTKYDSGTGWPSFYAPVSEHNVAEAQDNSLFMKRTEVLCARCDSHLGHIFGDGPAPTHKRFCINGFALKFEKK